MDVPVCEHCNTPLDADGACVTCRAAAQGLQLLSRSGYASVKEMLELLEAQGIEAEVDQVPPRREEEKARPLWNLYAPAAHAAKAVAFLQKDWAELLSDPEAARAAERGIAGIDLDAAGEIECPACGHRFAHRPGSAECPDCGLSLGAPAESAPDEAEH
jgi:rubrerythrin